jgi:hypothetical protein
MVHGTYVSTIQVSIKHALKMSTPYLVFLKFDSIVLCELMSFLDAYSGYFQISYTKMAFDLNNGGATC